ncbi:MAG: ribosomal RNA small subunit methyltransferase A [Candidatus Kaiserbacteria bacterium]|nr:MAG: ribosomal RNA small subunit methyltransferase A [Candidatus Kaiserbacteria bacterium]
MKRKGARLGQHFLTGIWAARALAAAAAKEDADTTLEIGPGTGALTRELLATGKQVVAVEKDEVLVRALRETFADEIASKQLSLIEGDVRDFRPEEARLGKYVVAANIPYYITGEIIRQFLTAPSQPAAMFLLIQKEVAQRIVSGTESILSLSVKAYGTPKILKKVSRGNFSPPPSVDSAILGIEHISRDFFADLDEDRFFEAVRVGFSSKRKFLASNLGSLVGKERVSSALRACKLSEKIRAEELRLSEWKRLLKELSV